MSEPQRDDYNSSLFTGENALFEEGTLLRRLGDFGRTLGNNIQDAFTDYRSDDLARYTTDFDAWRTHQEWLRQDSAHQREAQDLTLGGYSKWAALGGSPSGSSPMGQRKLSGGEAKRQAIAMALNVAQGMAQIGRTNAETSYIKNNAKIAAFWEARSRSLIHAKIEADIQRNRELLARDHYTERKHDIRCLLHLRRSSKNGRENLRSNQRRHSLANLRTVKQRQPVHQRSTPLQTRQHRRLLGS